jgi:RNA-directed DNA polymerase
MEATIRKHLERECAKLISRQQSHIRQSKHDQTRFTKRTGQAAGSPASYRPEYWDLHQHFDPFYVRSRLDEIAYGLARSIRAETYQVSTTYCFSIPKPGGGKREVTIFTIPDAAVAHYLYRELLHRNGHRFSSYSFAYRPDRTAHFAVEHLAKAARRQKRLFVLEYDFAKYFDTISHQYVERLLRDELQVSPRERKLASEFLRFRRARGCQAFRDGVLELDRELDSTGASFARYADDTVILCKDYEQANICAELMLSHGMRSATQVNFDKSDGISILTPEHTAEMRTKLSFAFLGYEIGASGVGLSAKAVKRIKKKISTIIHKHMLLYPKRHQFNPARIEPNGLDWDMVTCLNEIRRYLYGRASEKKVSECIDDKTKPLTLTKGLLSFYPLIDQPQALQKLDGWMLDAMHRAQVARRILVSPANPNARVFSRQELLDGTWYRLQTPPNETRLPSFFRAWLYIRKCLQVYGLMTFRSADYAYYPD